MTIQMTMPVTIHCRSRGRCQPCDDDDDDDDDVFPCLSTWPRQSEKINSLSFEDGPVALTPAGRWTTKGSKSAR
jgi:hypothetical protein